MRVACVLGSPACSPALSGFRTNPRAARLLGDLLPVLGVPLRVLGDLLRLLGVFNLSISAAPASPIGAVASIRSRRTAPRSAAFSTVQGKVKLAPPRSEGYCSGRRFSHFALASSRSQVLGLRCVSGLTFSPRCGIMFLSRFG